MGIPDFQTAMLPVLRAARDGEVKIGDVIEALAEHFALTDEERVQLLPSRRQGTFANRVHWAKFHLVKAGLVTPTRRGYFACTEAGLAVLADPPERLTMKELRERSGAYAAFDVEMGRTPGPGDALPGSSAAPNPDNIAEVVESPDDMLSRAVVALEANLQQTLLAKARSVSPVRFESLVTELLLAMGYGGSTATLERSLTPVSGDGGIDGVIDQDPLGLDRVYVQAKRYAEGNGVGAPAIRDFFGSLDRFKAAKGVFITTSTFTRDARETAGLLSKRIVLIDGDRLARLMIRYEVGCRTIETVAIKREDEDFFET